MFGFVRQSTYDADIAVLERENAVLRQSAAALREMTGELIDGMKEMGFDPNLPRRSLTGKPETTAGKVLRLLRNAMADAHALDVELRTAQRERDALRAQLKVFTDRRDRAKLNLRQYRANPNGTAAAVQSPA